MKEAPVLEAVPAARPVKKVLAAVAAVSVPLAIASVAGYGLYRAAVFMKDRLRPETEEEMATRLDRIYRENYPDRNI